MCISLFQRTFGNFLSSEFILFYPLQFPETSVCLTSVIFNIDSLKSIQHGYVQVLDKYSKVNLPTHTYNYLYPND